MKDKIDQCSTGGAIYGFGFIGAAIHFIALAHSFWTVVLGLLKAMVWPAFLVYHLFEHIS